MSLESSIVMIILIGAIGVVAVLNVSTGLAANPVYNATMISDPNFVSLQNYSNTTAELGTSISSTLTAGPGNSLVTQFMFLTSLLASGLLSILQSLLIVPTYLGLIISLTLGGIAGLGIGIDFTIPAIISIITILSLFAILRFFGVSGK